MQRGSHLEKFVCAAAQRCGQKLAEMEDLRAGAASRRTRVWGDLGSEFGRSGSRGSGSAPWASGNELPDGRKNGAAFKLASIISPTGGKVERGSETTHTVRHVMLMAAEGQTAMGPS